MTAQIAQHATVQVSAQVTGQVTAQVAAFCREPKPAKAIMADLGLKYWKTFQANYLAPLMAMGVLERTIPDKPRSRLQRYGTTEAGLAVPKENAITKTMAVREGSPPYGNPDGVYE